MQITERQKLILDRVIEEYINSANPVSSQLLERKYNFGICPATIRIEMQKLTDKGWLYQPHPSAGRVPTDKGYRLFVDRLLKEDYNKTGLDWGINEFEESDDPVVMLHQLIRFVSSSSSNLAMGYVTSLKMSFKDGWEEVLNQPELQNAACLARFFSLLKGMEEGLEGIKMDSDLQIFIGRENPFSKISDFSTIVIRYAMLDVGDSLLAIVGPKRMQYDRNICILESVQKLIENLYK